MLAKNENILTYFILWSNRSVSGKRISGDHVSVSYSDDEEEISSYTNKNKLNDEQININVDIYVET